MTICVGEDGTIQLPEEWLRKLGVGVGSQLMAEENAGGVLLKPAAPVGQQALLQLFDEAIGRLPPEVAAQWPTDAAEQHDHYLYGNPKQRPE